MKQRNLASVVPIESSQTDTSIKAAFKQQRLQAWQPILTPHWVIATFFLFGAVFFGLGIVLVNFASQVVESKIKYALSEEDRQENAYSSIEFTISETMTAPVYVYYELSGFYQNHRRYEKSRDHLQMRDPNQWMEGIESFVANSGGTCAPHWTKLLNKPLYPCGLVADTQFTDKFWLQAQAAGSDIWTDAEEVVIDESPSRIAWSTDVDLRFKNLDPTIANQQVVDMWILAAHPPTVCRPKFSTPQWEHPRQVKFPFAKRDDGAVNTTLPITRCTFNGFDGATEDKCQWETCAPSEDEEGELVCQDLDCTEENGFQEVANPSGWGVENGHFITWMRVAALPHFRKNYGVIDQDLEAGTTMRLVVEDRFSQAAFDGKKTFILSTRTWAGGKNNFLGWGYIVVGATCLLFGIFFLARQCKNPRVLGDVTRLDWMEFSGTSMQ